MKAGSPPRVRGKRRQVFSCATLFGDHPRACGEKHVESLSGTGALGSPPRMRGRHCNVEIAGKLRQITPCWKSIVAHIVRCVNKDRSPRVRGKLLRPARRQGRSGITPARAGKTVPELLARRVIEDHPRACGENAARRRCPPFSCGSPPRVRGKPFHCFLLLPYARITPARAGKTAGVSHGEREQPDHPRACGENLAGEIAELEKRGSPPRVREKRRRRTRHTSGSGITPARAGKTTAADGRVLLRRDHPRACRENQRCRRLRSSMSGSPPRVRGKHSVLRIEQWHLRITPARAGKTPRLGRPCKIRSDHPRACGENLAIRKPDGEPCGSPPRVRGKR